MAIADRRLSGSDKSNAGESVRGQAAGLPRAVSQDRPKACCRRLRAGKLTSSRFAALLMQVRQCPSMLGLAGSLFPLNNASRNSNPDLRDRG